MAISLPYTQTQAPLYLIVYDISHNKERNAIDFILKGYGFRVQKSVFECRLTRGDKQRLLAQLEQLNIQSGHIRCYSVNSQKVVKIGQVPEEMDSDYIYFIE